MIAIQYNATLLSLCREICLLGSNSWLVCLAAELFLNSCFSDTVYLWLCSAQLLKQQLAKYTSCFALAGSHLLNTVVLAVADGLFGLCGSERLDELFISTRSPPFFIPNKPYGFCRCRPWKMKQLFMGVLEGGRGGVCWQLMDYSSGYVSCCNVCNSWRKTTAQARNTVSVRDDLSDLHLYFDVTLNMLCRACLQRSEM